MIANDLRNHSRRFAIYLALRYVAQAAALTALFAAAKNRPEVKEPLFGNLFTSLNILCIHFDC
jgi:hypothetical protein